MKVLNILCAIFITASLSSPFQLSAGNDFRKGWIIDLKGDTLTGYINYQADDKLSVSCRFITNKSDKENEYMPSQIREYQFINEGRKFINAKTSVNQAHEAVFLEVLVQGKISLYYYKNKDNENYFFIYKKGLPDKVALPFKRENKTKLNGLVINSMGYNSTDHIDTLRKYMDDAPQIFPDIELINVPAQRNLSKLVKQYNLIFGEKYVSFKPKKNLKPLSLYLTPGGIYSTSRVNEMSKNPLFGGFQLSVSLFQNSQHYFLSSGVFLSRYKDYKDIQVDEQTVDKNFMRIPIKVEYRFQNTMVQPRFTFGYNLYNSDLGTFLLSAFSAGANVNLSNKVALSLMPEIEFKGHNSFSLLPNNYQCFNIFAGVQIKL